MPEPTNYPTTLWVHYLPACPGGRAPPARLSGVHRNRHMPLRGIVESLSSSRLKSGTLFVRQRSALQLLAPHGRQKPARLGYDYGRSAHTRGRGVALIRLCSVLSTLSPRQFNG